jgi:hypothetical protein
MLDVALKHTASRKVTAACVCLPAPLIADTSMTTVSILSTNSMTSSLPFLRASGDSCLKPLFSRSGNVGAVYCLTKSQVEGGYFYRRPSGGQALFQTPSTKPSFNTHSSRSGSVQRILSGVPAPGLSHSANFPWGAPPIECSSISDKYFRDCRLTCARLCHIAGVELEQIQFCFGACLGGRARGDRRGFHPFTH